MSVHHMENSTSISEEGETALNNGSSHLVAIETFQRWQPLDSAQAIAHFPCLPNDGYDRLRVSPPYQYTFSLLLSLCVSVRVQREHRMENKTIDKYRWGVPPTRTTVAVACLPGRYLNMQREFSTGEPRSFPAWEGITLKDSKTALLRVFWRCLLGH